MFFKILLQHFSGYVTVRVEGYFIEKFINKCIAQIKVMDFLINLSYDKQIINNKKYLKFGESMDNIIKYLVGWKKSINP